MTWGKCYVSVQVTYLLDKTTNKVGHDRLGMQKAN